MRTFSPLHALVIRTLNPIVPALVVSLLTDLVQNYYIVLFL